MSISTICDLELAIEAFNLRHPRPHGDISLTNLLDISLNPRVSWPSNESAGVYIFLD